MKSIEKDSLYQVFMERYRVVLLATTLSAVVGLVLMATGEWLHDRSHLWSSIATEAGKVVIVTSVVGLIFEFVMHDRFVKRVTRDVKRLDESIEVLQRTVAITSGAIESGLSAVYSDRQKAIDDIDGLLKEAKRGDHLMIAGISLGDFLCPHGRLYGRTSDALTAGINISALLLDMGSEAAKTRAQREEIGPETPKFGTPLWLEWYYETSCFDELKTASDLARSYLVRFDGQKRNAKNEQVGRFEARIYTLTPLCFLAIYGKTMFLESYHYAGRGGESPIMKIAQTTKGSQDNSRLFSIYMKHFNILCGLATPLEPPAYDPPAQTEPSGGAVAG
ncbi:MAG TPA: hypothetical protein VNN25_00075 [Thermoanaerobaculia bacterium]|nr:hypothetical protein [Thermoanaerobaculia bacterium]